MPSQAVQRISVRWLPEPAYEDTTTIALNVGGYFIDLRVAKQDQTIQWSRAGERIALKKEPPTFRWTRIIDSSGILDADEAYFEKLDNGDDLEIGTTGCPHKNGAMTDYEEIWRDITAKRSPTEPSWILQRKDGNAFVGKVGAIYLAIQQIPGGGFAVRREDREASSGKWSMSYESGDVDNLPSAAQAVEVLETGDQVWTEGQAVALGGSEYVVKGLSTN